MRSHRWRTVDNSAAYLADALTPGTSVLDVGCGPGTLTVDIARRVAPGQVVGVDVAESVVDEARAHAETENVTNVSFVVGDFRSASLSASPFDAVYAHQVLQHLRDPVGALAAMSSLARPGGLVAARDWDYGATTWAPASPGLDRWIEVYGAVARRNGAEPAAGRRLLTWARAAGLEDVTYTSSTWTFARPEDRQWWSSLWAERTVASSFGEQAVAYGIATRGELDAIADAWRAWAGQPDAVFILVHGEIVARV